jgi:hypothetical protein
MNEPPWTREEPILKATSAEVLGKNPNTLPKPCCLGKARMNEPPWTHEEPILKATSAEVLGKNPNTLPKPSSSPKGRRFVAKRVRFVVQSNNIKLSDACNQLSLAAEPGANPLNRRQSPSTTS